VQQRVVPTASDILRGTTTGCKGVAGADPARGKEVGEHAARLEQIVQQSR
jgi:hypothetical protein